MKNNPMPIGKPTYFQGDIRKIKADAFGFFYCNITTPPLAFSSLYKLNALFPSFH